MLSLLRTHSQIAPSLRCGCRASNGQSNPSATCSAVELDPHSPRAWSALAIAYSLALTQADDSDVQNLVRHCEAAATKALELAAVDETSPIARTERNVALLRWPPVLNARVALANCRGPFRRWGAMERDLRAVMRYSEDHPMPTAGLASLMMQVGRMRDAVTYWEQAQRLDPHIPVIPAELARAFWSLGRVADAEQAISDASETVPSHPLFFHAAFDIQYFDGRLSGAARALDGMAALGPAAPLPPEIGNALIGIAGLPEATRTQYAEEQLLAASAQGVLPARVVARYLAAFGAIDSAFEHLECHYFGGRLPSGRELPAPPPFARRRTDELFLPTARKLRADPRFAALTERLGLDTYWRDSGTRPQLGANMPVRMKI